MHSTERDAFDAQIGILFAAFPAYRASAHSESKRVEAYWQGLQKMPLLTLTRCVTEALAECEKLPTPNALWKISRSLRTPSAKSSERTPPVVTCRFAMHANEVLLRYLCRHPARDEATLQQMVAAKNEIASAYRVICEDEPGASVELLGKLAERLNAITGHAVESRAIAESKSIEAALKSAKAAA